MHVTHNNNLNAWRGSRDVYVPCLPGWFLYTTISLVLETLLRLAQHNMTTADAKLFTRLTTPLNTTVHRNSVLTSHDLIYC